MRRLAAVLGRDVSASLSPRLHAAAARSLGLDLAYVPVSCPDTDHFVRAVDALEVLGALGANVTVPYKRVALDLCAQVSSTAVEIGAVNTVTFSAGGRRHGDNTDGPGLVRALGTLAPSVFERVQILGAGGAARAAAWALAQLGVEEVHVTARRNAEPVAEVAKGRARTLEAVRGATLVVSCLPGDGALAQQALTDWVDMSKRPVVYDLAYGDAASPSALVAAALRRGLTAHDGRALLVEQAALSLSLWTGADGARARLAMRSELALGV
jgi:shikimate dehydrogenase